MKFLIAILSFAFAAASCSTITINQRHDVTEDFTLLRNYAWMPKAQASGNLPFDEPAVDSRIKKVVEQELHFKGFRKTPVEEADFLIGYQVAVDEQLAANDVAEHYDFNEEVTDPAVMGSVASEPGQNQGYIRSYAQGTLVLNVAEAKSRELIWWSAAQAEVHTSDPIEVRRKRIDKAVKKMLKDFPPK